MKRDESEIAVNCIRGKLCYIAGHTIDIPEGMKLVICDGEVEFVKDESFDWEAKFIYRPANE